MEAARNKPPSRSGTARPNSLIRLFESTKHERVAGRTVAFCDNCRLGLSYSSSALFLFGKCKAIDLLNFMIKIANLAEQARSRTSVEE